MKLSYRPEIDGLRAAAVFAVILYHAGNPAVFGIELFTGGFIGVDIFFVVSGYLIASLILKELEKTGKFSILHFYERRARRILPALLTVMLTSLPIAWIYLRLLPAQYIDFAKSIISSIFFSSNFYFHHTGLEYATREGLSIPFLHTWSLSVEEQFYIIFPFILIFCFNFFRKYLLHILIFGIIISLLFADWSSRNYPSFAFYALPTRGWELLAGAVLAKLELSYGRQKYKILNLTLPVIGLLLILHAIIFFNHEIFHPSFITISPIIGTMLFIWFSNTNEFFTKILASKLFAGLGLISYSLYLWHYPIFAFARIFGFDPNNIFYIITTGVLIIGLSIITYFLIEKPFRNRDKISLQKLIIVLLTATITLLSFNLYVIKKF